MEKFICERKIDPFGIEIDIGIGVSGWLITNPFLVLSRNSIRQIHYGKRKVEKLFDVDENWIPSVLRLVDYESILRFSKFKMAQEIFLNI